MIYVIAAIEKRRTIQLAPLFSCEESMTNSLVTIKSGSRTNCYLNTEVEVAMRDVRKEYYPKVSEGEWREIRSILEVNVLQLDNKFYACEVWV